MSGNCLSVAVYKGEGRFLVVPEIKCEGLWIQAQWYESFPLSVDCDVLGDCMSEAIKYIKNSKPLTWTSETTIWHQL